MGCFGIKGKTATITMHSLSGGQKSRVVLAMLTEQRPHILVLDEISNHQDVDAVRALIEVKQTKQNKTKQTNKQKRKIFLLFSLLFLYYLLQ